MKKLLFVFLLAALTACGNGNSEVVTTDTTSGPSATSTPAGAGPLGGGSASTDTSRMSGDTSRMGSDTGAMSTPH